MLGHAGENCGWRRRIKNLTLARKIGHAPQIRRILLRIYARHLHPAAYERLRGDKDCGAASDRSEYHQKHFYIYSTKLRAMTSIWSDDL